MKKVLILMILCTLVPAPVLGGILPGAEVVGIEAGMAGDSTVYIGFAFCTERTAIRRGETGVYTPVISDGTYRVSLPPVVIQQRRGAVRQQRHAWNGSFPEGTTVVQRGWRLEYSGQVPFQDWMHGASLYGEMAVTGCGEVREIGPVLLVSGILPAPELPEAVSEPASDFVESLPLPTAGDELAASFSFVVPEEIWNEKEPIYDEDRESALTVFFRVNSHRIDRDLENNGRMLDELITAIRQIYESPDTRLMRVVVAGFASPEGPFAYNDRLAWERAVAIKRYILDHTDLSSPDISLYNGSEDWRGLRALVAASQMREKEQILEIIDHIPIWDAKENRGRLGELMRLGDGSAYRYMLEHFFPGLRNGAFIRVYYENSQKP